jgi:hypothetical protein
MEFQLNGEGRVYAAEQERPLVELIEALCKIPAPSHHEERRAVFVKAWFAENGFPDVTTDAAQNVIAPVNCAPGREVVVFMAHTDTVFPDTEPMPWRRENGRLYCPGVGDDTANLAALMLAARYFRTQPQTADCGFLFVANACEEGLGNLKGCRQLMQDYAGRVREVISFDGGLGSICNKAVGSARYRVTVRTEGGHSFGAFGNRNAIHALASMIGTLYTVKPPVEGDSKTTYNVGMIEGGTSVNTIAQEASMLYEYRSDSRVCLGKMKTMFEGIVAAYRSMGVEVEVTLLGERPCMGDVNPARQRALEERLSAAIHAESECEPFFHSGSTDCNIPFSLGIPAICTGVYRGRGAHTREEYIELASLPAGFRTMLAFLLSYLG